MARSQKKKKKKSHKQHENPKKVNTMCFKKDDKDIRSIMARTKSTEERLEESSL